ncbi:transcriptional regulator, SARP family [Beutenbergia cavernae DSM 12333]|uniref:Transcriptional regulator, SARP family n=1 Tax=Beutenbergia cavernae (strain ATCC BAA-8 / DSM 12333 / CCUG 43141 / JCM 11478 / NBRC 16432 / NCIMB 13614 / HKI 0122) TaxID=471853 RepID=C5C012_BEUC1|nr:BTAD domain-containing putative transcriptional regulator [Beutenbergia cavernae]ACQ81342.1 transcriptional regulator, SARP family [Beutenbergia cavernae DSM 12333]
MRYEVLGELGVIDDDDGGGGLVPVPAGRQRLLLARLVAAVPRPVPVDALVEDLWPGGDGSRSALQVIVHRLRRRIGEDRLVLDVSGYRLVADPGDVDAVVFVEAVQAAWSDVDLDPARAIATLEGALALWRGSAYDGIGLESETLATEAVRLEGHRLDAEEARFSASLALGRSAELVGELREVVAAHPLRERFHAQLMLALYRSGRTADALDAYRTARGVLVEELGLEPGTELRDLEQAILVEDPVLSAPPAPFARPDAPVRPAQLPPSDPAFVGRDDDVAVLTRALTNGGRVVAIDGPGGVGKSALALHAAHAVAEEFPGGVLYANLRGATPGVTARDPAVVLERFLHALGVTTAGTGDVDDAAAELRTRTTGAGVLVVLDDAASPAQVQPLLPGDGSAAVVTSRPVLTGFTASARVHLDVVDEEVGVRMLAQILEDDRVGAEPEAAAKIVAACGRLPLAIRIVGAQLLGAPRRRLAATAERLGDSRARLDELAADDLAVRSSLELGLSAVSGEAATLFAYLGVVPLPSVTAAAVARLADLPLGVARRRLDDLARARMLVELGDETFAMHDLVRLVAGERATAALDDEQRRAAVLRLYRHYLASARAVALAMDPDVWEVRLALGEETDPQADLPVTVADGIAAAHWVTGEIATVAAVAQATLAATHDRSDVAALLAPLFAAIRSQGMGASAAELYVPFVEAPDARTRADVLMLLDSAVMREAPGAMARAAERPLAAARALGDDEMVAHCLNVLAIGLTRDGRHTDALERYREAVDIATGAGLEHARRTVMPNLAKSLGHLGRHEEAVTLLESQLEGLEGRLRAHHLGRLAGSHLAVGRPEAALPLYSDAIEQLTRSGHTLLVAIYTWHHASAVKRLGRLDEAQELRRRSLDLVVGVGRITAEEADRILADDPPDEPEELDVFRQI